MFIDCASEVDLFKEFPYTVCIVTPKFAAEQPEMVRRVAQTFGEANDMFHTKFGETVDLLKKQFPKSRRWRSSGRWSGHATAIRGAAR